MLQTLRASEAQPSAYFMIGWSVGLMTMALALPARTWVLTFMEALLIANRAQSLAKPCRPGQPVG